MKAQTKYIRQSALKIRRVLQLVRGRDVETALNILHYSPYRASGVIEKTLRSAVANYLHSEKGKSKTPEELFIKQSYVSEGPSMKRFRAAAMGRMSPYRRRTSHLTMVLDLIDNKQR